MSFLIAAPETMSAAATDFAVIGSALNEANIAALAATTGVLPAAFDEVSAAIAALFGSYGEAYQALSEQAATFHQQFVQALSTGAGAYVASEVANAQQTVLDAVNEPTLMLLGRP